MKKNVLFILLALSFNLFSSDIIELAMVENFENTSAEYIEDSNNEITQTQVLVDEVSQDFSAVNKMTETPEEIISRLQDQVQELQAQNIHLVDLVDQLSTVKELRPEVISTRFRK